MTLGVALQIRGAVPTTPVELITGASTLTQVVLIVLALLSLLSWAIMFALWRELSRAQGSSLRFFRDFERATRLEEAGAIARVTAPNALTRLFMRAAHFVSDTRVRNQQIRGHSDVRRRVEIYFFPNVISLVRSFYDFRLRVAGSGCIMQQFQKFAPGSPLPGSVALKPRVKKRE